MRRIVLGVSVFLAAFSAPRAEEMVIDLEATLRLAGANNLEIALAREKTAEAAAKRKAARQDVFLPALTLDSPYRRHEGLTQGTDGAFVDVEKQSVAPGVRASLEVHVGETRYALLAARRRLDAGQHAEDASRQAVLLRAAEQYFDLAETFAAVRVLEDAAALSEELLKQMEARVKLGVGYQVDVLRVKTELAHQRLRLLQRREAASLASVQLVETLALEPDTALRPAEDEMAPLALVEDAPPLREMLDMAWGRRPELQKHSEIQEAFRADWRRARVAPLFPFVRADVFAGQMGPNYGDLESSRDYQIFVGWKIGKGGLLDLGRRELYRSHLDAAEIEAEIARRRVSAEVVEARAAFLSKKEQLVLADKAVEFAEESFRLNAGRHKLGIALPLEVIQAEDALLRARLDRLAAVAALNKAQYRLKAALGGM
jgi:outer membrane protein TolC